MSQRKHWSHRVPGRRLRGEGRWVGGRGTQGTAWVGTLAMLAPASVRQKGIQLEQSLALHPPASGASTSLSLQGSSTFHSCQEVMASLLRPHSGHTLLDAHGMH